MNREDSVLDEIDRLVDDSIARGDRSQSFHGEQMRVHAACPWCPEPWHFLPITANLLAMRNGSYGRDEFGYGIVDPDYSYRDDESGVVCPGSEFHGPRDRYGTWDKQSRERAQERSSRSSAPRHYDSVSPSLPPGTRRRLRFVGPFEPWTVALDDEREIEDIIPGPNIFDIPGWPEDPYRRIPIVREHRLTATFELNNPLKDPSEEWVLANQHDILQHTFTPEGFFVTMRPVVIPFASFEIYATDPQAPFPEWVEFVTTYAIERHPWFMEFWTISGTEEAPTLTPSRPMPAEDMQPDPLPFSHHTSQGHESDYVIIDEAYEMSNERLRHYVEEADRVVRQLAAEAAIPTTPPQAPDEE